jgi:peptidoglycan/xylan/chitin deacetylase (PgdA/CDA1 family)
VPGRAVALTFDDGFENHYTNVLPVLRQYGFYATMFVITDRIGHRGYLSWDQVRKIEESGVAEIGSHSRSSRNLAGEVSDRVLNEEISGSKSILDSNLKNPTEFFAYPFGGYNNKVKELVRCAGYLCAVTVSSGGVLNNNDLFAIKRMAVSPGDNMFVFRLKVNGYYGFIKQSVRMILDKGHDDKE